MRNQLNPGKNMERAVWFGGSLTTCRHIALAAFALTFNGAVLATDLIDPISQERSVSGIAKAYDNFYYETNDIEDAATDFRPYRYDDTAVATVLGASSSGGGRQTSSINANSLVAMGGAHGDTEAWAFNGWGDSTSESIYNVSFEITAHVRARVAGTIRAYDSSYAETLLVGPQQALFAELAFGPSDEVIFDETLWLPPGQYRFSVLANGNTHGTMTAADTASAEYDVVLQLCPAGDIDESGTIDVADLAALLAGYGTGQTPAEGDLNADGFVDLTDLAILLANYGMSCTV